MPVTVKVNGTVNSLVHKGSNHVSSATIPDFCKTPSPGGPIPLPYPNVSQSAMLAKGTTTVKADGGMMIAIKGSEFSMSNGDEPGSIGGVKSSTFIKESTWILYSFDVKMEGKGACRLSDKKFQNHENTVDLSGCQGPLVPIDMAKVGKNQEDACEKLKEKEVKDHDEAARKAGMRKDDYDSLRDVSKKENVTVSFRYTNAKGIDNIGKIPCKPMTCKDKTDPLTGLTDGKPRYTGDYDMHDLISNAPPPKTIYRASDQRRLKRAINLAMEKGAAFPRIMHGPQATLAGWLRNNPDAAKKWGKDKYDKYLQPGTERGKPVTVFDNGKVYQLESSEDVLNMYRCKGAPPPRAWTLSDAATGKRIKR